MALASLAEFAALYGKSKQAAAKWKAKGFLVIRDGKVDIEPSQALLSERGVNPSTGPSTTPSTASTDAPPTRRRPAPPPVAVGEDGDDDPEAFIAKADDFIKRVLSGDYLKFGDAERIKENALALKHVLDGRQKAGALVEIETAEKVLFEQARQERDAWLNWPARVGPLIAATFDLEADRVTEVLAGHVQQHLADIGEPDAEFQPDDR